MVFLAVGPGRPLGKQHQHHVNDYSPRYNLCMNSERGLLYFPTTNVSPSRIVPVPCPNVALRGADRAPKKR